MLKFEIKNRRLFGRILWFLANRKRVLSIFGNATLKIIFVLLFPVPYKGYTSLKRSKIKLSENKYFGLRKPIVLRKKKKKAYFCILIKSVILPGKLSILCNTVQIFFFFNIEANQPEYLR